LWLIHSSQAAKECEGDRLSLPSAKVKNVWSFTSVSQYNVCHDA